MNREAGTPSPPLMTTGALVRSCVARRLTMLGSALAMAGLLLLASVAHATDIGTRETEYARVRGTITVHNDVTTWNLRVDRIGGNRCVFAKITVDRNNANDDESQSPRSCGDPVTFDGRVHNSRTRSARITLCQDRDSVPDNCRDVWTEPER